MQTPSRSVAVVIFPDFELLDVFGPLEMYGMAPETFHLHLVAEKAGPVASRQGPISVAERAFAENRQYDLLLVPGGQGTRTEVDNPVILDWLAAQAGRAEYVCSVCTGSALLARAGLLDGVRATTNKMAFAWVAAQREQVKWEKEARWVEDGRFFTSSGVSAGMDMSLAMIARILDQQTAEQFACWAEYEWHQDAGWDPFARIHGLV
jgi:transcriptional regulator GlxA family with amidase domain